MSEGEGVGSRKYCLVPRCGNSSTKLPNKKFIFVPRNEARRKAWLKAVRTTVSYSKRSSTHVCEDHFNLKEDAENYMKLMLYGGQTVVIKEGVVPYIFQCQSERTYAQPPKERPVAETRARKSVVRSLLYPMYPPQEPVPSKYGNSAQESRGCFAISNPTVGSPRSAQRKSASAVSPNQKSPLPLLHSRSPLRSPFRSPLLIRKGGNGEQSTSSPRQKATKSSATSTSVVIISPRKKTAAEALCELGLPKRLRKQGNNNSDQNKWCLPIHSGVCAIPVHKETMAKPETKDASITAKPYMRSKFIQSNLPIKKDSVDVATSPIKILGTNTGAKNERLPKEILKEKIQSRVIESSVSESTSLSEGDTSYKGETTNGSNSSIEEKANKKATQAKVIQDNHIHLTKNDPLYYIGVTPSYFYIVDVLAGSLKTDAVSVLICLQKMRLNQAFKGLAYDSGVSESFCSKVFYKFVPSLSECLSTLILWPDKNTILSKLPIYFRTRYSHVQSIIDCFEVEIEKPSDPIKQTLTWSQYKKCNTMKYEISCTPDGYINFVSGGFGGRTSDAKITETCGYLDVLPERADVMAVRGFKGIAPLLEKKQCSLIRPPSVAANQKSSKEEVKLSKRIASLRIHIERVIRRVREFSFLKPHACVNHSLIKYLDCVVKIVCGLINLSDPIIKKFV